jgi:hypothetical protein
MVLDDIDAAMRMLRRTMKGLPAESANFKSAHDRLAKSVAAFKLTLEDAAPILAAEGADTATAADRVPFMSSTGEWFPRVHV